MIMVEPRIRVKHQRKTLLTEKHSITKSKQLENQTTLVNAGLVESALIFMQESICRIFSHKVEED